MCERTSHTSAHGRGGALSDDSLAYPSHAGLRDNETRDLCRVHNCSRTFYH